MIISKLGVPKAMLLLPFVQSHKCCLHIGTCSIWKPSLQPATIPLMLDYFRWEALKNKHYTNNLETIQDLNDKIYDAIAEIKLETGLIE